MWKILSHQGFATGQAYARDPKPSKGGHDTLDFIKSKPVFRLLEVVEALRHTVATAQIAAVCHREADVLDRSVKGVDKLHRYDLGQFDQYRPTVALLHCVPL